MTYEAVWLDSFGDYQGQVEPLFPDLGVWSCYVGDESSPDTVKVTALYLTATSTATESGDPIPLPTYSGTRLPINEDAASQAPIKTSDPRASKPEEAATTLPETPSSKPSLSAIHSPVLAPNGNAGQPAATSLVSVISSSDAQGHVSSMAQLPAVILASSNRQGSPVAATSLVGGSAPGNEAAPIVLNNLTISRDASAQYLVSEQPLALGSPVTLGSGPAATLVAIHTSNSQTILVVGSSTSTLAAVPPSAAIPAATVGAQILTPNSKNQYVVGIQTLAPGVPITLGSGDAVTPVVLRTSGGHTIVIAGSSTQTLSAGLTPGIVAAPAALTIGSQVLTANSEGQYAVGTQTLAPGSPITLGSGNAATPVSLQTSGSQTVLVAGSVTSTLVAAVTAPPPFTIGSQVVTANADDQYVVGSHTLTPGEAITASGTPVSLAPGGTQVVVGTSTERLGNYILSGLGAGPTSTVSAFTGAASRQLQAMGKSLSLVIGMMALIVWL